MKRIIVVMLCMMLLTSVAFARQESGTKPEAGKKGIYPDVIKVLNLSPEQVETIHQNRTKHLKEKIEIKNKIQLAMVDLQEEIRKEKLDKKKIDKLVNEIGELRKESFAIRVDSVIELRDILTEEQLEKARALALFRIEGKGFGLGYRK